MHLLVFAELFLKGLTFIRAKKINLNLQVMSIYPFYTHDDFNIKQVSNIKTCHHFFDMSMGAMLSVVVEFSRLVVFALLVIIIF